MPVLICCLSVSRKAFSDAHRCEHVAAPAEHTPPPASQTTRARQSGHGPQGAPPRERRHTKQPKPDTARKSYSKARLTATSEPILLPKLRISFADFPYLHYSMQPEAVHLGDLLRIWVRPSTRFIHTLATPRERDARHAQSTHSDFQGPATGHWTLQEVRCFTR